MAKAIIESAINDVALTKSLNPHVAYDSMEIADDAIATRKAGAALVHFHVRDAETGKSVFEHNTKCTDACSRTRAQCDVLPWPSADIMSMTRRASVDA